MKPFSFLFIFTLLLCACDTGPQSPRGFSLPEGNSQRGEEIFVAFDCLACHQLKGYEDQITTTELSTLVTLGGDVTRIKTYAELVTSVINPSHRIAKGYAKGALTDAEGQSIMRNYNDYMTVSELIDLVAFLQPKYHLKEVEFTQYPTYYP